MHCTESNLFALGKLTVRSIPFAVFIYLYQLCFWHPGTKLQALILLISIHLLLRYRVCYMQHRFHLPWRHTTLPSCQRRRYYLRSRCLSQPLLVYSH
ncbi:hypothetical protein DFH06DRAFT_1187148 [Mycena polygramma]|nr:hypothetical protein DFH06DRAFT_1187148 [Mycena polygramma]